MSRSESCLKLVSWACGQCSSVAGTVWCIHEELRPLWERREALPSISIVFLIKCSVSVYCTLITLASPKWKETSSLVRAEFRSFKCQHLFPWAGKAKRNSGEKCHLLFTVSSRMSGSLRCYLFISFSDSALGGMRTKRWTDTFKLSDYTHHFLHSAFRHIKTSPSATWQLYSFFFAVAWPKYRVWQKEMFYAGKQTFSRLPDVSRFTGKEVHRFVSRKNRAAATL